MSTFYDTIVIGLGAMGSATLYQLSQSPQCVLGIDRYEPPHNFGSSHGDTRITRQAIGEGSHYVPLVLRAHEIWRSLEGQINEPLFHQCGGVIFGVEGQSYTHGSDGFLSDTVAAAEAFCIEHELLGINDLRRRFPQFHYKGTESGYYEPGAGFLRPEACIRAQLQLGEANGATLALGQEVLEIAPNTGNDSVRVVTTAGEFVAEQVVITTGAWITSMMPEAWRSFFTVYRQVLYWFEPELPYEGFHMDRMPVYIRCGETEAETFYGFPAVDGNSGGIKVAAEQFHRSCTPATLERNVSEDEQRAMFDHVSEFMKLSDRCVKSAACMYTVTPDFGFVIDHLPGHPQIHVASPCSGHGFKHSATIGQILSERVLNGTTTFDISAFSMARFANRHEPTDGNNDSETR